MGLSFLMGCYVAFNIQPSLLIGLQGTRALPALFTAASSAPEDPHPLIKTAGSHLKNPSHSSVKRKGSCCNQSHFLPLGLNNPTPQIATKTAPVQFPGGWGSYPPPYFSLRRDPCWQRHCQATKLAPFFPLLITPPKAHECHEPPPSFSSICQSFYFPSKHFLKILPSNNPKQISVEIPLEGKKRNRKKHARFVLVHPKGAPNNSAGPIVCCFLFGKGTASTVREPRATSGCITL